MDSCDNAGLWTISTSVIDSGCDCVFGTSTFASFVADKVMKFNDGSVAKFGTETEMIWKEFEWPTLSQDLTLAAGVFSGRRLV